MLSPWTASAWHRAIGETLDTLGHVSALPTWTLNNHDTQRSVTRYGRAEATHEDAWRGTTLAPSEGPVDEELGRARALAAFVTLAANAAKVVPATSVTVVINFGHQQANLGTFGSGMGPMRVLLSSLPDHYDPSTLPPNCTVWLVPAEPPPQAAPAPRTIRDGIEPGSDPGLGWSGQDE